jgi:hypothetical protein
MCYNGGTIYIESKERGQTKMSKSKVIRVRVEEKLQKRIDREASKRGMDRSSFIRHCIENELPNPKEVIIMTRKEIIKEMEGSIIKVDGKWLAENDEEMLDWLTGSDYWGRGFEDMEINPEDAVLEMHFESRGVAYKATFEGHPEGVEQSLNNQPMWGDDSWEDWGDNELLKKYYLLVKNNG